MAPACCSSLASQQPPHCAQILYCLFNQRAAASDPAGIHEYSEHLIGRIVPNLMAKNFLGQLRNDLADRLAKAEQAARAGDGRLVPEAAVVKAFNDLMQEIGAPPSVRASEASVHGFREHAASIDAFPALFSAGRNGANCNPGEAVFILSLLIEDNGLLYEKNLDVQKEMMQPPKEKGKWQGGGALAEERGPDLWWLLSSYPSNHNRNATVALFNHVADTLGF